MPVIRKSGIGSTSQLHLFLFSQTWVPTEGPAAWRMDRFSRQWRRNDHIISVFSPGRSSGRATKRSFIGSLGAGIRGGIQERTPTAIKHSILGKMVSQGSETLSALVVATGRGLILQRPDVVMATVPAIPSAFSAYVISRIFRVPLVIDLRDAWPDLISYVNVWDEASRDSTGSSPYLQLVKVCGHIGAYMLTKVLRRANLIVTTAETFKDALEQRGYSNIVTIRNAAISDNQQKIRPIRQVEKRRELNILYAGTVGRAQGLSNAIRAIAVCKSDGIRANLRIVGSGAELNLVKRLASDFNVEIEFIAPVPHSEMGPHYAWCDVALIHLRDWFPLGMTVPSKLYESMARKIPIVLCGDGESASIVEETGAGLVVRPMDANALADAVKKMQVLGAPTVNGEKIERWLRQESDPEVLASKFVEAIESVCRGWGMYSATTGKISSPNDDDS